MRESKVESHLRDVVLALGGECFKWVSPGRRGVNDRLVFLPNGVMFMIETKAPGKTLDDHQKRFRKRMRELGFEVYVLDTIEAIDRFFGRR